MTLLGGPPKSTFFGGDWVRMSFCRAIRWSEFSYLFGIYSALQVFCPSPTRGCLDQEAQRRADIGGRSALDRMLSGQVGDLYLVRQYLDAQRGGKRAPGRPRLSGSPATGSYRPLSAGRSVHRVPTRRTWKRCSRFETHQPRLRQDAGDIRWCRRRTAWRPGNNPLSCRPSRI